MIEARKMSGADHTRVSEAACMIKAVITSLIENADDTSAVIDTLMYAARVYLNELKENAEEADESAKAEGEETSEPTGTADIVAAVIAELEKRGALK